MTLDRDTVVRGTEAELLAFAELIGDLSEEEWQTPTRCAGWVVADIAGHVVGIIADVAAGRFAEVAEPDAPERQAAERRGWSPPDLVAELKTAADGLLAVAGSIDDAAWAGPAPAGIDGTLGFAAEALWYDAYIHADDIRDALGRPSERGAGLQAAVSHVMGLLDQRGWRGDAALVEADPLRFLLVATGRAHPVEIGLKEDINVYR